MPIRLPRGHCQQCGLKLDNPKAKWCDLHRKNKYRSQKTGAFHSKSEARRYTELVALQQAGFISNLQTQVAYPLVVGNPPVQIATWFADFVYVDTATGNVVVEDHKGFVTPVYRLKKKLVQALYGIKITETRPHKKRFRDWN